MLKRSLVVSTATFAALALVVSLAWLAPARAEDRHVWVMRDSDGHDTDASAGWLGVRVEEAVDNDEGGALVRSVVRDSPAAEAGLQEGDIIVAVDGRAVRGPASLTRSIRERDGGERVTLTVLRDGREQTIDAELGDIGTMVEERIRVNLEGLELNLEHLGERLEGLGGIHLEGLEGLEQLKHLGHLEHLENMDFDFDFDFDFDQLSEMGEHFEQMGRVFVQRCEDGDCEGMTWHSRRRPLLGVGLSETTPELRQHLGGDEDSGALVDRVVSDSPAEAAGMRVGDLIVAIDGEPVKSAWEIRRALSGRAGERLRIDVIRDGSPLTLDVDLPRQDDDDDESRGPRA